MKTIEVKLSDIIIQHPEIDSFDGLCQVVESSASSRQHNPGFGSCSVGTRDLSPVRERSVPKQTIMNCFQMVSPNAEQIVNLTVDPEKPLSLSKEDASLP